MASKKKKRRSTAAAQAGGAHGSASDFIREQLAKGLSPREIIEAGKNSGLKFSANLVYAVKSKRAGGGSPGRARKASARGGGAAMGAKEFEFKKMAFQLGIGRARELLDELEARITRLLGP